MGKLEKHNVTLVATSAEPLGNLATEGKFDAALLSELSASAVMLPPLRTRRDDIPPLIERYWRESKTGERGRPSNGKWYDAVLSVELPQIQTPVHENGPWSPASH